MSNDFFGGHGSVERKAKRGLIAFGAIWVFSALLSLSLIAGLVYVVWHFLAKVW